MDAAADAEEDAVAASVEAVAGKYSIFDRL